MTAHVDINWEWTKAWSQWTENLVGTVAATLFNNRAQLFGQEVLKPQNPTSTKSNSNQ